MPKIAVVGEMSTAPEDFAAFYELMATHAAASRQEPGCLRFDLATPLEGEPGRLLLYELYADRPSFDAHAATERLKAHRAKTGPLIRERRLAICELRDSHEL